VNERPRGAQGADAWVAELADSLAVGLRDLVRPEMGTPGARGLSGRAAGGDTTFTIDEKAEAYLERRLAEVDWPVATYSEDRGLHVWGPPGTPLYVLIVDPIDGTRPAVAGLEAACTSVAVARWGEAPVMDDVVYGVVVEIKEGGLFRAGRGQGAEGARANGVRIPFAPSANGDLSRLFWTIGFRGRPAAELVATLGGLIDMSSVDGGVFDLGSATYCMTRLLTGQLDAYIDVGPRMIEIVPEVEDRFREVGRGALLNNSPYDVAATTLILSEAGCPVTDAAGRPLGGRPLLGSDRRHQMSVVASANLRLHEAVLAEVERGMAALASHVRCAVPRGAEAS
jgi:myo-inositol-1(or 4)-monophosphatase